MADREVLRRPASGPEADAPHRAGASGPATPRWAERGTRSPDCGCDHCRARPRSGEVWDGAVERAASEEQAHPAFAAGRPSSWPRVWQLSPEVGAPDDPAEVEADRVAEEMTGVRVANVEAPAAESTDVPTEVSPPAAPTTGTPVEPFDTLPPATYDDEVSPMSEPSGADGPAVEDAGSPTAGSEAAVPESPGVARAAMARGSPLPLTAGVAERIRAGASAGVPLPTSVRDAFEPHLGVDFGQVRVHDDATADGLNRELQARAFTTGTDVYFRAGQYRPDSVSGRSLLAHELVHVAQQAGPDPNTSIAERSSLLQPRRVASPGPVRRKPDPGPGGAQPESRYVRFTVKVPETVRTMEEVFRLYERTAYGREIHSTWKCGSYCDLDKIRGTVVPINALRSNIAAFTDPDVVKRRDEAKKKLTGTEAGQKAALSAEADRRFRQATGDKPTTTIKAGEEGRVQQWDDALTEVMADSARLDQLAPAVRKLLAGKKPITPQDFARLLQIADKLAALSAEDLEAFSWLTVRATDNLDLFEKSVDVFIRRKAELVKAFEAERAWRVADPPDAPKDDLQAAFDEKWKDLDEKALATMSESERLALAERKADELTAAQLTYMKDHPGETLKDFVASATLANTGETFDAIEKDLTEAADGDANSWARWAGGVGAGAKLSGWVMAVAGVLYVASWLTGVGELATIAAVAAYALGATITLSALERDLRVKAASQAKDPREFKRNIQLAAAAQANVIVSVALIVVAAALHFVAKTYFPKTVAKMRTSLLNLRERIRLLGSVAEIKPVIAGEMAAHRAEIVAACEEAKTSAAAMAKEVEGMTTDQFVDRLESGRGDFLDRSKAPAGERVSYRELATTPEGRAAIEEFRRAVADALRTDAPAEIDTIKQNYLGKIDEFVKAVDAAANHEQLGEAAKAFEPALGDEYLKALMSGEQTRITQAKITQAEADLAQKAQQLQPSKQAQPGPTEPGTTQPKTEPPKTEPPKTEPPKTEPPKTEPPKTEPPKTEPPKTEPPEKPSPTAPADAAAQAVKAELTAKITELDARLAEARQQRAQLRPLQESATAADEAVKRIDLELKQTTDTAARAKLNSAYDEAIRARRKAADEVGAFLDQHDLAGTGELDYYINAVEKERAALNDALNPKPGVTIDESQPLGGAWNDVPTQTGEVNHMPAKAASPLSKGKGPSIRMDIPDHYATRSWGSGKNANAWRAVQENLIKQGKFLDALKMDIDDVRAKFGPKYEKGIQQMLDYVAKDPAIKALSKNSTVTVQELRMTSPATTPTAPAVTP